MRPNWDIRKHVQLNQLWVRANGGAPPENLPKGLKGVVIGHCRQRDLVKVKFDGMVTPQTFHEDFLEGVE